MKTGLVMEGGAMRGMFTAGVTDILMENHIVFDGGIGVSAGAVFGCNYKSEQIGRVIRYNKRFCNDRRYCSLSSLIRTGNLYNADFAYRVVPKELDIFDKKAFSDNPMEFYVTVTDVSSGTAVYKRLYSGDDDDILWMRASASMPVLSRAVEIEGAYYLDGGISDSIPIKYFESIGYDKNVVILTQPKGYIKKKNKMLPYFRIALRKYPALINTLANRHKHYNDTIRYIDQMEAVGKILVIRPPLPLEIGASEKDENELERVYRIGRSEGMRRLEEVIEFIYQKQ